MKEKDRKSVKKQSTEKRTAGAAAEPRKEWISSEASVKMIQYVMLAVLFGLAFFLPAYGVKNQVKESTGESVQAGGNEAMMRAADESVRSDSNETMMRAADGNVQSGSGEAALRAADENAESGGGKSAPQTADDASDAKNKGTIVLDAGHGGDDPGMIGGSGINEKTLNLIYAKKLGALLTEAGYRVVQTRETEDGLYDADETHKKAQDMQRRCAVIAKEQPLIAVSIHQNSYPQDSSVCGPQVFYYEHSAEGERLAGCIQDCMNAQLEIARPRVQKGNASYYILKRSASTTVIVECGFLTNPAEEAQLQEEEYQDRLVQAVCDGIVQYLEGTASG